MDNHVKIGAHSMNSKASHIKFMCSHSFFIHVQFDGWKISKKDFKTKKKERSQTSLKTSQRDVIQQTEFKTFKALKKKLHVSTEFSPNMGL